MDLDRLEDDIRRVRALRPGPSVLLVHPEDRSGYGDEAMALLDRLGTTLVESADLDPGTHEIFRR